MVEIDIVYEGELRCAATHTPSGVTLRTDAPRDNQGRGELFSPTDLVATALGTCVVTIMAMAARRWEIDLQGTAVRVFKIMTDKGLRRIARLEVEIDVASPCSESQRGMLQRAADSCPVRASLHPDVQVSLALRFPGEDGVEGG